MNKSNQVLAWSIFVILIVFGYGHFSTSAHEEAHAVICGYYGGDVINMTITMFGGETYCGNVTAANFLSYSESQSMVEAFGYQMQAAMLWLIMFVWGLGLVLCLRGEKE
jgi:hypothetical protein